MRERKLSILVLVVSFATVMGCASSSLKKTVEYSQETIEENQEAAEIQAVADSSYAVEESILNQILEQYDYAVEAHREGDYGLAETKVEAAFMLSRQVNFNEILDDNLVARFKEVLSALAQEYGRLINETSVTAEEDPMSWFEDIDAEQFKSGLWTDEELKRIIMKIATKADVPIEFNEKVRNSIYYFQNGGKEFMEKCLKRRGRYLPLIREVFSEESIPLDMAYLSMIESGFNPKATSRARAVGLWQFIYSTGKLYGLSRNQWVDERRDPVKSTVAAAKHLSDLYELTDDWNNVMAAYNCGARRIRNQLEKTQNLEYWNMELPRETRNYVPIFMAAVVISKAPEIFGFTNIAEEKPFEYETVEIKPYTSLSAVAQCAGCTVEEIRELNPELLLDHVPPYGENYLIRIPKNATERFIAEYKKMPEEKYEPPKVSSVRVKRGDTLSSIARRYGISVSSLRAANKHISNINKLKVGQKINIPGMNGKVVDTSSIDKGDDSPGVSTRSSGVSKSKADVYKVQKNDTLGSIASKFNTSIKTIQELNNMGRSTEIYYDQRLLVPKSGESRKEDDVVTSGSKQEKARITYIVQQNDTIYEIARKYGVDYKKIKELNDIIDHTKIIPGQKLIIEK